MSEQPTSQGLTTLQAMRQPNQLAAAFTFTPKSITEAMEISKVIASSELCPENYLWKRVNGQKVAIQNPAAMILQAVMMGARFGFDPFQAVRVIAVINGRPMMWGQGCAAVVISSPHCESLRMPSAEEIKAQHKAVVIAKRKGQPEVVGTFDDEDAKMMHLDEKDTYVKDWPDMYLWRAFHRAVKVLFSDVLMGLVPREIGDDYKTVDAEYSIKEPQEIEPGKVDQFLSETGKAAPRAEAAAPISRPATANAPAGVKEWVGQIASAAVAKKGVSKDKKTGADKPWTIFKITGKDGTEFGTFDEGLADLARSAAKAGDLVRIAWEEGQYGKKILPRGLALEPRAPATEEGPEFDEPGSEG